MLKTEYPSTYSRHKDYYQLWLEKKQEIKKLETNLLDSKKVIRTLHQKLTDILRSIKVFEASQNLATSNQEQESDAATLTLEQVDASIIVANDLAYQSIETNDGMLSSVDGIKDKIPVAPEDRVGFVNEKCETQEVSTPAEIQPLSVLDDSLNPVLSFKPLRASGRKEQKLKEKKNNNVPKESFPRSTDVQGEDSSKTCNSVRVGNSIVALEEQLKVSPSDLQVYFVDDDQEILTRNVMTSPEAQPFQMISNSLHSDFGFQAKDTNQIQIKSTLRDDLLTSTDVVLEQEANNSTCMFVPNSDKVKIEPCVATGSRSELVNCDQGFPTESTGIFSEICTIEAPPDSLHSEFLFESKDPSQLKQNGFVKDDLLSSEMQVEVGVPSRELSGRCGNLSVNIFESFKAEPVEKMDNSDTENNLSIIPNNELTAGDLQESTLQGEILEESNKRILRKRNMSRKDLIPDQSIPSLNISLEDKQQASSSKEGALENHQALLECSRCHKEFKIIRGVNKQHKSDTSLPRCRSCQQISGPSYYIKKQCGIYEKTLKPSHNLTNKSITFHNKLEGDPKRITLTKQLESHSLKSSLCSICGESFTRSYDVRRHVKTVHLGEKPFECDICLKYFTRRTNLIVHHKTVHMGEKPYECDFCQKRFSQHSNLIMHLRTHMGVKPYERGICPKKFS